MKTTSRLLWLIAFAALLYGVAVALFKNGFFSLEHPDRGIFPVWGIDVSHHQGKIDWMKLSTAGVGFAYIKSSEGKDFVDPRFQENWQAATATDVPHGAYHFFTFCTSGREQAENALAVVPVENGVLPIAADIEFSGNCRSWKSIENIRTELKIFLELVEQGSSKRPLLYVTGSSYDRIVAGQFRGYEVWMRSKIWRPSTGITNRWSFWQYANDGDLSGITGPVDLNVYRGTRQEFGLLLQGGR
ncbi:MAG: lysozyme [bacterium]|nr:lysozyme [bacterium]